MKRYYLPMLVFSVLIAVMNTSTLFRHSERAKRGENLHGRSKGFTTNYASAYLGATLTDFSPTCHDASSVLNEDNEKYMLCPCDTQRKYFTVQLIRGIEVRILTLVNHEHFSSRVQNFTVLGSSRYPTNEWRVLGHFEADPWRGTQHFDVANQQPVRFLRFLWASSHGEHSWCTLTTFKAFGVDVLETLTEDYTVSVEEQQQQQGQEQEQAHEPSQREPFPSTPQSPQQVTPVGSSASHDEKSSPDGVVHDSVSTGITVADISAVEDSHDGTKQSSGRGFPKYMSHDGAFGVTLNGWREDGSKFKQCSGTVCNSGQWDAVAQRYCSVILPVGNASQSCFPHERDIYVVQLLSVCMSRAVLSNKVSVVTKPFASNSVLLLLTQMSRQIKGLQHEVVELGSRQKEMELKRAKLEVTVQWLGAHLKDSKRSINEYRDKLQDSVKQIEVLKSKLTLRLHLGENCEADPLVRFMVIGSVTMSLFASVLSCVAVRSFYRPRRRASALLMG